MKIKSYVFAAFLSIVLASLNPRNLFPSQPHEFLDEEIDYESVFSDLPENFDLSSATALSLSKLPYFTLESAKTVIAFRDSLSTEYIRGNSGDIPGLSPMEQAVLKDIITKGKWVKPSLFSGSFRQGVIHNPQDSKLNGNKYFSKFIARYEDRLTVSLLGEHDRYEPRAFDLFSGNAEILLDSGRTKITIGDYRPGFGQGLLFSRYGRIYGSGAGIMQSEAARVANTTYEETRFLRGAYISVKRKIITTQTWFSIRRLDATLDESGNAVNIRDTGYHVSDSGRENLAEKIYGARSVITPFYGLSCALEGVVSNYSPVLARMEGESYYHYPEGSTIRHIGVDGTYRRGPMVFFYEYAVMNREEYASIGGINITKPLFKSTVVFRRYSEGYMSLRAGGFSAFGATSNEKGIYSSIQLKLPRKTSLIASLDLARMLYRTKTIPLPSSRRRINIVIKSQVNKKRTVWFGMRSTDDALNSSKRWNVRAGFEERCPGHDNLRFRSKFAWSEADGEGGPFFETALIFRGRSLRCSLTGGIFDLPSYKSRFYRYEYDVPGRGYTRAVWGRGGTVLIVVRWASFSVRYRYSNSDLMDISRQVTLQYDEVF